jgi:hypothetical protein
MIVQNHFNGAMDDPRLHHLIEENIVIIVVEEPNPNPNPYFDS